MHALLRKRCSFGPFLIAHQQESSGFEAAARAAASIFESGRVPDAAGVDLLARRAPGAAPVAGGGLAVYDGLAAGR